jgi:glycerate-2-kinase
VRRHADGRFELAGRPYPADTRFRVLAAGKAASAMAASFAAVVGSAVERGLVVTKDGHARPLAGFELRESGHPLPDERSERAGREALALAAGGDPAEVFVLLLSGGASSLLATPLPGLTRSDLAATTEQLLACGADIGELNCVRKHLLAVSGGRLARACGCARMLVLAISDVPGDDLAVIGSGPCEPDPSSFADALSVVSARGLGAALPEAVLRPLESGAAGRIPESVEPDEPGLPELRSQVVAASADAVTGAIAAAEALGMRAVRLGPVLSGEARQRGREIAALARSTRPRQPTCLIGSGETTVTLVGQGRGGRNQELALAAAIGLEGAPSCALLAAGTDGSDGPTDAAGAHCDGGTLARGRAHGLDAADCLARNDSYGFFAREGGLLRTGPTDTNVMDLVLVAVGLEDPEIP